MTLKDSADEALLVGEKAYTVNRLLNCHVPLTVISASQGIPFTTIDAYYQKYVETPFELAEPVSCPEDDTNILGIALRLFTVYPESFLAIQHRIDWDALWENMDRCPLQIYPALTSVDCYLAGLDWDYFELYESVRCIMAGVPREILPVNDVIYQQMLEIFDRFSMQSWIPGYMSIDKLHDYFVNNEAEIMEILSRLPSIQDIDDSWTVVKRVIHAPIAATIVFDNLYYFCSLVR